VQVELATRSSAQCISKPVTMSDCRDQRDNSLLTSHFHPLKSQVSDISRDTTVSRAAARRTVTKWLQAISTMNCSSSMCFRNLWIYSININPLTGISLRLSGAYSDLTIRCGHFEAQVHKCVVCPQSEFFRKACESGRWKVSTMLEKG
jgi:hypothetical protein